MAEPEDLELELRAALSAGFTPPPASPAREDALLADARAAALRVGRARWRRRALRVGGAAAAVLLVALAGPWAEAERGGEASGTERHLAEALEGDLDGDGRRDVLDALHLARAIEGRSASDPRLDLDGDGEVSEGDLTVLLDRLVRLDGPR